MGDDHNETVISIEHNLIAYNENHIDDIIEALPRGKTQNWEDCNIVNICIVCNENRVDEIIEFISTTETNTWRDCTVLILSGSFRLMDLKVSNAISIPQNI